MHPRPLIVVTLFVLTRWLPAQSTRPATTTTAPTTAPAVERLDQGRVRIVPPAGWTLVGRGNDGLSLRYRFGTGEGVMAVIVNPQEAVLQRQAAPQMAKVVAEQLRNAARNEGMKFLIQPRVEPDDRFFLKVRDRTRAPDGTIRDQLQVYRTMQLELLHVAIVATVPTEEQSKPIFAAGEAVAESAKLGTGPKPTAFRRTRVRLTIPPDWKEQRKDDPNGVVATYTHPDIPGARLVVRCRIIPKEGRTNPQVQEFTLDQLVDDYRNDALPAGAINRGEEVKIDNPPFKRYLQRSLTWNEGPWGTDFRAVVVGDVAIGVESLVPPQDLEIVKLANEMALSIKPMDDKPPGADSKPPAAKKQPPPERQKPEELKPRLPPPQTPSIPGIPSPAF